MAAVSDISEEYQRGWQPFHFRSADGLDLFARDYGTDRDGALPLFCLPGLTRNSKDFHSLARALAEHATRPRRVLAFEFRGRGRSGYDPDPANYAPQKELEDVLAGADAAGIDRFAALGTSRGGIVGMLCGVAAPERLAALALNDVGPVVEADGIARIVDYVGNPAKPADWAEAVAAVRRTNADQFPRLGADDWLRFAYQIFRDTGNGPAADYDPALAASLEMPEPGQPLPTLWDVFDALSPQLPLFTLRGANSDVLSSATVTEMAAKRPGMEAMVVDGEGHAPLLWDKATIDRISAFLADADTRPAAPGDQSPQS